MFFGVVRPSVLTILLKEICQEDLEEFILSALAQMSTMM